MVADNSIPSLRQDNVPVFARTGAEIRRANLTPGSGKSGSTAVQARNALAIMELLNASMKSEKCTPSALAQLARAWKEVDQHRRFMLGLPNPKPVEPRQRKRNTTSVKVQPVE